MRIPFFLFIILLSFNSFSQNQEKRLQVQNASVLDTTNFSNSKSNSGDVYKEKATINQYLIISLTVLVHYRSLRSI